MPISASAKKSLRAAERRAAENKIWKVRMKNAIKRATVETLSDVFAIVDKAAKRNVIHDNKADRLKARLYKRVTTVVEAPVKVVKAAKTKTATVKKTTKKA